MYRLQQIFLYLPLLLLPLPLAAQQPGIHSAGDGQSMALREFIRGIHDFENEDYESALDHLTTAHLKFHNDPGINYALADVYLATGDLANASYYAAIAADLVPENKWYHFHLAEIYGRSGQHADAIGVLEEILTFLPEDTDVLYRLAEAYTGIGELQKSNAVFDRILKQHPENFELHLRKFQNYNALQLRDSALAQLEIMREINPGNLSTLHSISQYYLDLGDASAAEEVLNDARERNSRDPQTLILLAEIFIRNGEWEQLGEAFMAMLADPLIYPSQKMDLARFLYLQQQNKPEEKILEEQTERVLDTFSSSEPEYGPAQLIAADFFLQQNRPEKALNKLENASRTMPDDDEVWAKRIQTLFAAQQYEQVIALSDEVSRAAPDNAIIQFFTGTSYRLTDRPEEAVSWLERAAASPARRNFRSVIYGAIGDVKQDLSLWVEAGEAYEMSLRLDPGNHNTLNNYAYFLSQRGKDLERARDLSGRSLALDPENAAYLDTMGWIHYLQKDYEQALDFVRQSVDTGEAGPEVYEHLGDIYRALEDYENAKRWWEEALERDPGREYLKDQIEALK